MWKTPCGILTACAQCAYYHRCNFASAGTCERFVPNKQAVGSSKWDCDCVDYSKEADDLVCYQVEFPYPCACRDLWEEL